MARIENRDKELLLTGRNVDMSAPENAYMGGEFLTNENDYIEILIYSTTNDFIESAVVNSEDYILDNDGNVKLKTGTILRKLGYDRGQFIVKYNFLRKIAGSYENLAIDRNTNAVLDIPREQFNPNTMTLKENKYYIHEISPTRQELRLAPQNIRDEKYLRDFYDVQKNRKTTQSDGSELGKIKFIADSNTSDNDDMGNSLTMQFSNEGQEFISAMVGGTLTIPQAFITSYTAAPDPNAGQPGNVVDRETEGNIQARFYFDRTASEGEITNNSAVFGDEFFKSAFNLLNNNGDGFDFYDPISDDISSAGGIFYNKTSTKYADVLTCLYNAAPLRGLGKLNPIWFLSGDGAPDARVVLKSNSILPNLDIPTNYYWEIHGWDFDGLPAGGADPTCNLFYERLPGANDDGSNGGDFTIETISNDPTVAVQDSVNSSQAKTLNSSDGSTLIFKVTSWDSVWGVKLKVEQPFEGSTAESMIFLPCMFARPWYNT